MATLKVSTNSPLDTEGYQKICAAIEAGSSVLVLAEVGMTGSLPQQIAARYASEYPIASAVYKGSGKRFYEQVAEQLDIPNGTKLSKARNEKTPAC